MAEMNIKWIMSKFLPYSAFDLTNIWVIRSSNPMEVCIVPMMFVFLSSCHTIYAYKQSLSEFTFQNPKILVEMNPNSSVEIRIRIPGFTNFSGKISHSFFFARFLRIRTAGKGLGPISFLDLFVVNILIRYHEIRWPNFSAQWFVR